MKLEDQVCTLEQAKKFKELGIYQLTKHRFHNVTGTGYTLHNNGSEDSISGCCIAAFTVAELGVMLPSEIFVPYDGNSNKKRKYPQHLHCFKMDRFCVNYTGGGSNKHLTQQGETEAEARAAMLIYLLENNLTTPEEVNKRLQ